MDLDPWSAVEICGHVPPLIWGRGLPDMLNSAAHIDVEPPCLVVNVPKHHFAVRIVCDTVNLQIHLFNYQLSDLDCQYDCAFF